ncbi:hypothetical protein NE237_026372 [Protea cynaroides]|uniref:Late embryogenesis abundant protein LEA-2 subgroup domain-containing protein n=1 Tax=Protea cynaroides TaxID=273540 RepID=A0A9Q0H612_9MAGN|nr:hypothetical protein NE237_026372 [Protea cynaroides]
MADYVYSCCQELQYRHGCSCFQKCCFFILVFLVVIAAAVGATILIVILILKPRKPSFSLQSLTKDSFKLDVSSGGSDVYLSFVASLTMNAQNPNKFGLNYTYSRLGVLHKGTPIGTIEIPEFYQPARSNNISVRAQLVLEHVNVNQIIGGLESRIKDYVSFRVVGDVRSHLRILHITLPTIKVAIDCKLNVDYQMFIFNSAIFSMRRYQRASVLRNSPSFSTECSLVVCI